MMRRYISSKKRGGVNHPSNKLKVPKKYKGNSKVRNAIPNTYDGIKFKSRLETYAYKRLKEEGLTDFEYEKHKFILIPKFEYNGEKIRCCYFLPDFVDKKLNIIIECKGWKTDIFLLKYKLFKKHLKDNNLIYDLYLPRNQSDVIRVINDIKSKIKKNAKNTK